MDVSNSTNKYAGFWLRLCAFFIDSAILCVAFMFIQLIFPIPLNLKSPGMSPFTPTIIGFDVFSVVIVWLYYALLESGRWQATLGKRLLKIKVTDTHGNRISFARATGRYFSKILSSLILCIGYLMILFTQKQQGLHDIIAETLVVRE